MHRRSPHIVIITHEHDEFESRDYLLRFLAALWLEKGYRVSVVAGLDGWPDADLAILHVDLSVVPEAYVAASARYPIVLNGSVIDIRKRHVSRHLLGPADRYGGPVVIKTDLNAGGWPEYDLMRKASDSADLPVEPLTMFADGKYPIVRSAAEIAGTIWSNPALVVERFLPEQDARGFWLRVWVFLGDAERCTRYLAAEPIVKSTNVIAQESVPVPDELRAERRRLGFDYGKFDFTICNGEAVLLDANRTPSAPPPHVMANLSTSNTELADAIDRWLVDR